MNGELWGRTTDVPWGIIFPTGGDLPRHPSQLYEAALEGAALFIVLDVLVRAGALRRPGLVAGAFGLGYAGAGPSANSIASRTEWRLAAF